ncbi:MAG: RluA family pseudouridine synthase [Clostridia bacterium]|nr:RluA family pseudouridine synthase [Clostridia bacterium]
MEKLTVGANDAGQRLDKFLTKTFRNLPKSMMYKFIRTKKIKVNRKRAEIGQMLAENDTVELFLPPEFLEREQSDSLFKNIRPSFGVVYEDENLLICNKPVGMLSHADKEGEKNTLIEHVKAYLWQKGEYSPEDEQSFAPALCNRIDRNTCGLVLAAKNAETLRVMNEKIKKRAISKFYLCRVHGVPKQKEATLTGYLKKDADANKVEIFQTVPKNARYADDYKRIVTKYRVLAAVGDEAILEVELVTGRTHQIRAHMASIGHPLLGDGKYAENSADRKSGVFRQALCSYKLRFEQDEPSVLDYLEGKTFALDMDKIPFCKGLNG